MRYIKCLPTMMVMFVNIGAVAGCAEAGNSWTDARVVQDSGGLTISVTTGTLLEGSFSRGSWKVDFRIEHNGDSYVSTLRDAAGTLLLRASQSKEGETLEIGEDFVMRGVPGSIFGTDPYCSDSVQAVGEPSNVESVMAKLDEASTGELASALSMRRDIDLTVLPPAASVHPAVREI